MTTWSTTLKKSSSFSAINRNTALWDDGESYLLKEDSFFLFKEDGYKFILDQSIGAKKTTTFSNINKS